MLPGKAQNRRKRVAPNNQAAFKRKFKNGTNSGNSQINQIGGSNFVDFNDPAPVRNNIPNRIRKLNGGPGINNRPQQQQQQQQNRPNRGNKKNGWNHRGPLPLLPPPPMMPNMNFRNMPLRNRPPIGPPMPLMGPLPPPLPLPPLIGGMGRGGPLPLPPMGPIPGPMNGRFRGRGRMPPIPPLPMRPMPPPLRSQQQKFNNKPIKKNLTKVDKTKGRKNLKKNKGRNNKTKLNRNAKRNQPAYPLDVPFVTDEIRADHDKKEEILQRLKGKKDDQLFAEFKQQRDLFVKKYEDAKKAYEEANKAAEEANKAAEVTSTTTVTTPTKDGKTEEQTAPSSEAVADASITVTTDS